MRKKVDTNQVEIVETLRKCGFSVCHLHECGKGVPDLAIARAGLQAFAEVKFKKGKLTDPQLKFHAEWKAPIYVLRTVEDVLDLHKLWKLR